MKSQRSAGGVPLVTSKYGMAAASMHLESQGMKNTRQNKIKNTYKSKERVEMAEWLIAATCCVCRRCVAVQ
jgi:hypothetical protein